MKAICFQAVESISTCDIADPQIENARDAIVQVSLAGLCGSDLHPFFGRETGLDVGSVMGHEMVGKVVATGDNVTNFSIGDRVYIPFSSNCGDCFYCQQGLTSRCTAGQLFGWVAGGIGLEGCQSEFVRVPLADATMKKVDENLSDTAALLLGSYSQKHLCRDEQVCEKRTPENPLFSFGQVQSSHLFLLP